MKVKIGGAAAVELDRGNEIGRLHERQKPLEEEGLLDRFPAGELYGLHNAPGLAVGRFGITPGTAMAGGGFFNIVVRGRGAHGARPQAGVDPVIACCHIATALQTVGTKGYDGMAFIMVKA